MSKRFYRPELDAVRFLAFMAVFLHHCLPIQPNGSWKVSFTMACGFGLSVFFTLSAYLITTLLLRERAQTGTVSLPLFYKRRILRIWPLYFLALAYGALFDLRTGYFYLNPLWYPAALVMAGNMAGADPVDRWTTLEHLARRTVLPGLAVCHEVSDPARPAYRGTCHGGHFKPLRWRTSAGFTRTRGSVSGGTRWHRWRILPPAFCWR